MEKESNKNDSKEKKEKISFSSLGINDELSQICQDTLKWTNPTQIQVESIPQALKGKDIIGLAETGSGKTGAFVLPILQKLINDSKKSPKVPVFYAICLAPTRELAFQISKQFEALGEGIGLRCVTLIGGIDVFTQQLALGRNPHVIVGTPGRVVDHLKNTKGFSLRGCKFLVLDEADRLLNMDFEKEIVEVVKNIPRDRQTFLFSATMTKKVEKLQRASLHEPVRVEVSSRFQTVETLIQQYLFIPAKYKDVYLAYILNELTGLTTIVFTATVAAATRLSLMLRNLGFGAIPLHGQMSQDKRLGTLNKFKSGSKNILIATDVASRGLDIPSIDLVINYDIPDQSKDYIHRVGRTARAGKSGRAISFVTQYDVEIFQRIENVLGEKMDEFSTNQEFVLVFQQRVEEAQRYATMTLRALEEAQHSKKRNNKDDIEPGNKGKRSIKVNNKRRRR